MAPIILFCRACAYAIPCVGKIPSECPECRCTAHWTTNGDPVVPWVLTYNDTELLLKRLRISTT